MRIFRLMWVLFLFSGSVSAQKSQQIDIQLDQWHANRALLQLPDDYQSGSKRYPLIVFLHGKSRSGTDLSKLAYDGIPYWINNGVRFQAVNPVDAKLYKFIVVCPQALEWGLTPKMLNNVLDQVVAKYRVDTTRIYLTGYSAGGWATVMAITENLQYSKRIAAAVPMSPNAIDNANDKRFHLVADANVHCWYFGGTDELSFLENSQRYADSTNNYKPGLARLTVTPNRHCCWKEFYDPAFRQEGMNIYEWMLQYKR